MTVHERTHELDVIDRDLVELLSAALVDPELHSDVRARVRHEISRLLQIAYDDLYGADGRATHERTVAASGDELPKVLEAVLVDPNLHTDMRAHIHRRIEELVSNTRPPSD